MAVPERVERTGRVLTLYEAEARTGRKVSSWRKDILERRIPYVKIGRSVRIPEEVIIRMIRDGWREAVPAGTEEPRELTA